MPTVVLEALAAFKPGESGLVFTNHKGQGIRRNNWNEAVWRPAAKAVGLPPRTGYHALRHFYASLLIARGCSVKSVQERLGHASASETLDTDAHLWPLSDDQTRAAVENVLGARVASPLHPEAIRL